MEHFFQALGLNYPFTKDSVRLVWHGTGIIAFAVAVASAHNMRNALIHSTLEPLRRVYNSTIRSELASASITDWLQDPEKGASFVSKLYQSRAWRGDWHSHAHHMAVAQVYIASGFQYHRNWTGALCQLLHICYLYDPVLYSGTHSVRVLRMYILISPRSVND